MFTNKQISLIELNGKIDIDFRFLRTYQNRHFFLCEQDNYTLEFNITKDRIQKGFYYKVVLGYTEKFYKSDNTRTKFKESINESEEKLRNAKILSEKIFIANDKSRYWDMFYINYKFDEDLSIEAFQSAINNDFSKCLQYIVNQHNKIK